MSIELPPLPEFPEGFWQTNEECRAWIQAYARAAVEPYRQELVNIANAARFDRNKFETDSEFANWAQSRARALL